MSEEEFIGLSDRLAREGRFANAVFPIMLRHPSGRGHPFPCIHTDRNALLAALKQKEPQRRSDDVRIESIYGGLYVAVPRTENYRLERARQLLEVCGKMNAEGFCNAFAEQWNGDVGEVRDILLRDYRHDKTWTEYMLGRNDSFLGRLARALRFSMAREWYTLDAVYYNSQPNLFPPGGVYPACLDVLIEHENGNKVEEETWKLLMFRAPLKVLIFYDYREDEKERDLKKKMWLKEKLDKLFEMGKEVTAEWPEADGTEYLFLVGNRADAEATPSWRYWIVKPGNLWPNPLSGSLPEP